MGLSSICTEGFRLDTCRCKEEHRPLKVKPCPEGHPHRGFPMDTDGKVTTKPVGGAMIRTADGATCQRCQEWYKLTQFRGGVCFFCADALAEVPISGYRPDSDERPEVTS